MPFIMRHGRSAVGFRWCRLHSNTNLRSPRGSNEWPLIILSVHNALVVEWNASFVTHRRRRSWQRGRWTGSERRYITRTRRQAGWNLIRCRNAKEVRRRNDPVGHFGIFYSSSTTEKKWKDSIGKDFQRRVGYSQQACERQEPAGKIVHTQPSRRQFTNYDGRDRQVRRYISKKRNLRTKYLYWNYI